MNKYYKSYFLRDFNVLSESEMIERKYVFNVFFSEEFNCTVAEELNRERKVNWVLYYTSVLTKDLLDFHARQYESATISLCEQLEKGVKLTFFESGKIVKYLVETFNADGTSHISQEFGSNYDLWEYRERIYGEDGIQVIEKIFFADSWTIHEEKIF